MTGSLVEGGAERSRRIYELWCELVYLRALATLVARRRATPTEGIDARRQAVEAQLAELGPRPGPMERIAERLALDGPQVAFFWAATALSGDPRIATHADDLGGPAARRGLSTGLFSDLFAVHAAPGHELTLWLSHDHNPLVIRGLLVAAAADDDATPASRPFAVPRRVHDYLRGDSTPDGRVRRLIPGDEVRFDDGQASVVAQLRAVLGSSNAEVVVIEGPLRSGRQTAAAVACGGGLVALDLAVVEARGLGAALLALRREAFLSGSVPLLANVDELSRDAIAELARAIDGWDGPVVLTSARPGLDVSTRRPTVRIRWPLPEQALRRELWAVAGRLHGDDDSLTLLAHRYQVGAGAIASAAASARMLRPSADALDAEALEAGLRHNIAEQLGGLAHRVEVTQRWDDLVLADDTRDQVSAMVARIRDAPRVLDDWGYRSKLARGAGVAALFSGAPGTGKTMVAGLIARELDLELYQVDTSQIVSKYVGETEKQLARVFDAAEAGHALLLFDEADALFGQRSTEMKGAVDRYANLEVNFLLQRVEAFGGVTILTTNLDTVIDRALKRRLAAHIVFEEPDDEERVALWARLTYTRTAPLADGLDFAELAHRYPKMTGANIRNAAIAAAFRAASDGSTQITNEHLERAARVEYRAMGYVLSDRGGRER